MRGGPSAVSLLIEGIEVDVYEEIRRTPDVSTSEVISRLDGRYDPEDIRGIVRMLKSKDLIRKNGHSRGRNGNALWRVI